MKTTIGILLLLGLLTVPGDTTNLYPERPQQTTGGPWQLISLPTVWWDERGGRSEPAHLVFKLNTDTGETYMFNNYTKFEDRTRPSFQYVVDVVMSTNSPAK